MIAAPKSVLSAPVSSLWGSFVREKKEMLILQMDLFSKWTDSAFASTSL